MANESYTVTGKLYKKNPMEVKSDKFSKIDFIIETDGQYPQYLQIQAGNDKMQLLDNVNVGDTVTANVNVKGRLWQDKCFNSLELWQLTSVKQPLAQQVQNAVDAIGGAQPLAQQIKSANDVINDTNDLLF